MKRVNIQLKDDVHTKAKIVSVLKDITLNEYFAQAIERALEQDSSVLDRIKKKL